jgi:hypothetical protein
VRYKEWPRASLIPIDGTFFPNGCPDGVKSLFRCGECSRSTNYPLARFVRGKIERYYNSWVGLAPGRRDDMYHHFVVFTSVTFFSHPNHEQSPAHRDQQGIWDFIESVWNIYSNGLKYSNE